MWQRTGSIGWFESGYGRPEIAALGSILAFADLSFNTPDIGVSHWSGQSGLFACDAPDEASQCSCDRDNHLFMRLRLICQMAVSGRVAAAKMNYEVQWLSRCHCLTLNLSAIQHGPSDTECLLLPAVRKIFDGINSNNRFELVNIWMCHFDSMRSNYQKPVEIW